MKIKLLKFRYSEDVARIQKALVEKGYFATPEEAEMLWRLYSDDMCAGWMSVPDSNQEIFDCISGFIED